MSPSFWQRIQPHNTRSCLVNLKRYWLPKELPGCAALSGAGEENRRTYDQSSAHLNAAKPKTIRAFLGLVFLNKRWDCCAHIANRDKFAVVRPRVGLVGCNYYALYHTSSPCF